jgi:hypothetical protein
MAGQFEVTVADVRTMPRAFGMDLIVVGGPTHAFGMSRPGTRQDALRQGAEREGVVDVGLREWLDTSPQLSGIAAAAFDTKVDKPFTGSAGRKADRRLRRLGCRVIVPAESFHVDGTPGPLADGEHERARRWGETVAAAAVAAMHRI